MSQSHSGDPVAAGATGTTITSHTSAARHSPELSPTADRKVSVPNAFAMPPPKPTLEVDLDAPISSRRTSFSTSQRLLASPTAGGTNSTPLSTSSFGSLHAPAILHPIPPGTSQGLPSSASSTPSSAATTVHPHPPTSTQPNATGTSGGSSGSGQHPQVTASTASTGAQTNVQASNNTSATNSAASDAEARQRYTTLVTSLARTHRELAGEIDTATVYMRQAIAVNKLDSAKAAIQKADRVMQNPEYIRLAAMLHPTPETAAANAGSLAAITSLPPGIGLLSVFESQLAETRALLASLQAESATVVTYYLRQGLQTRSREVLREAIYKAESIDKSLLDRSLLSSAHALLHELDQRQLAVTYLTQALSIKTRDSLEAAAENARNAGLTEDTSSEFKDVMKQLRNLQDAEAQAHAAEEAAAAAAASAPAPPPPTESAPARIFKRLFSIGGQSSSAAAAAATAVLASGGLDPMYQFAAPLTRAISKFGVPVQVNTVPLSSADSSASRTAATATETPEAAGATAEEHKMHQFQTTVEVPLVVRDLVEHLRSRAIAEPGLFRLAGNRVQVDALISAYEAYCSKLQSMFGGLSVSHGPNVLSVAHTAAANSSATATTLPLPPTLDDVHDCSNALKQFFRELPTPLIPYAHYPRWLDVAAKLRAEPAKLKVISVESRTVIANEPLKQLRSLIASLDAPNRNVLQYVCEFLHNIALHQEFNKMSEDNLAIVFSPNLLKPQVETPQTLMSDAGLLILVVSATIRYAPYLFDDKVQQDATVAE